MTQNRNSVIMGLDVTLSFLGANGQEETLKYHGETEYVLNEHGFYTHVKRVGDNPTIGEVCRQVKIRNIYSMDVSSTLSVTRNPKITRPDPFGFAKLFEVYFFHDAQSFATQVNIALGNHFLPKPANSCEGILYAYANNAYITLRDKAKSTFNWATAQATPNESANNRIERAKFEV